MWNLIVYIAVSQNFSFTAVFYVTNAPYSKPRHVVKPYTAMEEQVNFQSKQQQDDKQPAQTNELVPKIGRTSVIWLWFGYKKTNKDQTTALCKECRSPIPTTDSNTSNFFITWKRIMKRNTKRVNEKKQQKLGWVTLMLKRNSRRRHCNRPLPTAHHIAIPFADGRK